VAFPRDHPNVGPSACGSSRVAVSRIHCGARQVVAEPVPPRLADRWLDAAATISTNAAALRSDHFTCLSRVSLSYFGSPFYSPVNRWSTCGRSTRPSHAPSSPSLFSLFYSILGLRSQEVLSRVAIPNPGTGHPSCPPRQQGNPETIGHPRPCPISPYFSVSVGRTLERGSPAEPTSP